MHIPLNVGFPPQDQAEEKRDHARAFCRVYIRREDILSGDISVRGYLRALGELIDEHRFIAADLRIDKARFDSVVAAASQLPTARAAR